MRQTLITLAVAAVPRVALACSVCFGQSDSPMAWGTRMGVFFMLGITVSVLAAFACFFVYLMRRAKLTPDSEDSGDGGQYVLRASGPVLHASESRFAQSNPGQKGTTRW
jgi:uncharacterized membrane protein